MKRLFILLIFISLGDAFGQSYSLIEDNPEALSQNFVNVDLLGIDYGAGGFDGAVYIGGSTLWAVGDKLMIEGVMHLNLLNIKGKDLGLQTEAGVGYIGLMVPVIMVSWCHF